MPGPLGQGATLTASGQQIVHDNHLLSWLQGISLDFQLSLQRGSRYTVCMCPEMAWEVTPTGRHTVWGPASTHPAVSWLCELAWCLRVQTPTTAVPFDPPPSWGEPRVKGGSTQPTHLAILQRVGGRHGGARELPSFSDEHAAQAKLLGQGGAEQKASGVQACWRELGCQGAAVSHSCMRSPWASAGR